MFHATPQLGDAVRWDSPGCHWNKIGWLTRWAGGEHAWIRFRDGTIGKIVVRNLVPLDAAELEPSR